MSTIANELLTLNNTKLAIKEAIINKGVEIGEEDTFASYADKIAKIKGGGKTIDTSKADYQIGTTHIRLYDSRYLAGFGDMGNRCVYPVVNSNLQDLDVDWTKDFEIGVRFNFSDLSSGQSIFASSNANYELAPTVLWSPSNGYLTVLLCSDGTSWSFNQTTTFTPVIDTWYFFKMQYTQNNNKFICSVSEDGLEWTILIDTTLSFTIYYNGPGIVFGGRGYNSSSWATNNFYIDTFNTYIKDDSGSIVWGCSEDQEAEYELWDYIQSDGTQVIDIGYIPTNNDSITVSNLMMSTQTSSAWIWGATDPSNFIGVVQNSNNKSVYHNTSSGDTISYISNQQNIDTISSNRNYSAPLCIFGFKLNGTYHAGITTRIYFVKINNNYYLPCRRKSNGAFGLWDVANQKFLGDSAGGNAFTGGSKIGNINIASPSVDEDPLEKYSIITKKLEAKYTGAGSTRTTTTYTFDEDGYYITGFATWSNANYTTSITYSGGSYTSLYTLDDRSSVAKIDIAYVEAGTTATYDWVPYWAGTYFAIKLEGVTNITDMLFSDSLNGSSTKQMTFTNLSSSKNMVCFYLIEAGDVGDCMVEFNPSNYGKEKKYKHFTIFDNGYKFWHERYGVIFFNDESNFNGIFGRYISGAGCGSIFTVLEIE